jgi:hypothetical protein
MLAAYLKPSKECVTAESLEWKLGTLHELHKVKASCELESATLNGIKWNVYMIQL